MDTIIVVIVVVVIIFMVFSMFKYASFIHNYPKEGEKRRQEKGVVDPTGSPEDSSGNR